jgi:MFS family permease
MRAPIAVLALTLAAGCNALFGLANAAMLPLAGTEMTATAGEGANLLIAASIVVPQFVVAGLSPWVGHAANRQGRRPMVILCFTAVALRGLLFALLIGQPQMLILVQVLDGVSAAVLGVLLPLMAADLTRGTNRFNLCIGVFGLANGLGATFSTTVAGLIADRVSTPVAFLALAGAAICGAALTWLALPETRRTERGPAAAPAPEIA